MSVMMMLLQDNQLMMLLVASTSKDESAADEGCLIFLSLLPKLELMCSCTGLSPFVHDSCTSQYGFVMHGVAPAHTLHGTSIPSSVRAWVDLYNN